MIDDYFQSILATLRVSRAVKLHHVRLDQRSHWAGYVRGEVYFLDNSRLYFREFVNTEAGIERFAYSYHYQGPRGDLIFRYDNTSHFPHLPNFPHHKHVGTESSVVSANAPDLATVLNEIERLVGITHQENQEWPGEREV